MSAQVPSDWTADKVKNLYKSFHRQIGDSLFPKAFNMMLFGKVLDNNTKLSDILNGRTVNGEVKIYVLPDRNQVMPSATDGDSKRLSVLQNEAIQIVEANQFFYLLSEYLNSLVDAYDPRTSSEIKQIILRNFPFMDTKLQELILKYSKFYGNTQDNPFVDDNLVKLFDLMGIIPKPRDRQAVKEIFYRPKDDRDDNLNDRPQVRNDGDIQVLPDGIQAEVNRRREELENLIENIGNRANPEIQHAGNAQPAVANNARVNQ